MKQIILFSLIFVITSSCAGLQYKFYNPKVGNTSDYNSFVVLNNCEESQDIISDDGQDMIIKSFSNKLSAKGINPESNQIADLIVSFYVKSNYYEEEDICFDNYEDYILGPICKGKVITYEVNTLVIDFFDTEKNTVVFHSAIEGLNFNKPEKFSKEIDTAISKILVEFDSHVIIGA